MDTLSHDDILEAVEQLMATFEEDEDRFYVPLDIAQHLHAELTRILSDDL